MATDFTHDEKMPTPNDCNIDTSLEEARVLHRVVRAMHDGHCPKCGNLEPADNFVVVGHSHRCPKCGFEVTDAEAAAALAMFRPQLAKCTAIFERWAQRRTAGPVIYVYLADLDTEQKANHLREPGGCPYCGSAAIEFVDEDNSPGTEDHSRLFCHTEEYACRSCGREHRDVYKLVDVEDVMVTCARCSKEIVISTPYAMDGPGNFVHPGCLL